MLIPPYLRENDTIGLTCPAGYMDIEKTQICVRTLEQWGFRVVIGKTLGQPQQSYFSGTDAERLADLQQMLDDDHIKAVFCARGGYGMSRIIDNIHFKKFKRKPKWVIGYSDITLLHAHLTKRLHTASLHAPMAAAFNEGTQNIFIQSLRKALTGEKGIYDTLPHAYNQFGQSEGLLVGGNLCLLAHSIGSKDELRLRNKILFLEDVGEYLYNIDRMLIQLKRANWLKNLGGLILGSFSDCKDTTVPFGKSVHDIIREHIQEYDYPYCFNFPVGHTQENLALKCGVKYKLSVEPQKVNLIEL